MSKLNSIVLHVTYIDGINQQRNHYYHLVYLDGNLFLSLNTGKDLIELKLIYQITPEIHDFFTQHKNNIAKILHFNNKDRSMIVEAQAVSNVVNLETSLSIVVTNPDIIGKAKNYLMQFGELQGFLVGQSISGSSDIKFVIIQPIEMKRCLIVHEQKEISSDIGNPKKSFLLIKDDYKSFSSYTFEDSVNSDDFRISMWYGKINFVEERQYISYQVDELLRTTSSDIVSYMNLWSRYNKQEETLVVEKAQQLGIVEIGSIHEISGGVKLSFSEKDFARAVKFTDNQVFLLDQHEDTLLQAHTITEYVGIQKKAIPNIRLQFSNDDINWKEFSINCKLPAKQIIDQSGNYKLYMALSLLGDEIMFSRRRKASQQISKNNLGIVTISTWLTDNPIPLPVIKGGIVELDHTLFENKHLTPNQIEAIRIICNTPDIAIIHGPPGTGKTTVIKEAITQINTQVKRFSHHYSSNLVTGYRHETVTNLIEKIHLFGLPAVKIGVKNQDNDENTSSMEDHVSYFIERLYEGLCEKYSDTISRIDRFNQFDQLYSEYKNFAFSIESSIILLERLLKIDAFIDSIQAQRKIRNMISKLSKSSDTSSFGRQHFVDVLYRIPTTKEALEDSMKNLHLDLKILSDDVEFREDVNLILDTLSSSSINFDEIGNLKSDLIVKYKPAHEIFLDTVTRNEMLILLEELSAIAKIYRLTKLRDEEYIISNYIESLEGNPQLLQDSMLEYVRVLGTTNQQAVSKALRDVRSDKIQTRYENVFVDEAATSSPLDLLIPMSVASRRIILVGDHRQLPHIIDEKILSEIENDLSHEKTTANNINDEIKNEINATLFEKLFDSCKKMQQKDGIRRVITLNNQFRMHPDLGNFISKHFYQDEGGIHSPLTADEFTYTYANLAPRCVHWIDVPYQPNTKYRTADGSRSNIHEATSIVMHIKESLMYPVEKVSKIGVISIYRPQVQIIKRELDKQSLLKKGKMHNHFELKQRPDIEIEIGTVDSFQGKEFDVVYLSTGYTFDPKKFDRSKETYSILKSLNRLCVALSRQKKLLIIVGNRQIYRFPEAIDYVPSLVSLLSMCESREGS